VPGTTSHVCTPFLREKVLTFFFILYAYFVTGKCIKCGTQRETVQIHCTCNPWKCSNVVMEKVHIIFQEVLMRKYPTPWMHLSKKRWKTKSIFTKQLHHFCKQYFNTKLCCCNILCFWVCLSTLWVFLQYTLIHILYLPVVIVVIFTQTPLLFFF